MMDTGSVRGVLRLAPDIGFTRLPFGGGVLLNRRTLAIAECDERDAGIVASLLDGGPRAGGASDARPDASVGVELDAQEAHRMATQLLQAGWLVAVPDRK